MRTDIAGLVVIALLGSAIVLLLGPPDKNASSTTIACLVDSSCFLPLRALARERFWIAATLLVAAIWVAWRARRAAKKR